MSVFDELRDYMNSAIVGAISEAMIEYYNDPNEYPAKRLRNELAVVLQTNRYYILMVTTFCVAVLNKNTSELYDGLELVGLYTDDGIKCVEQFKVDYTPLTRYPYQLTTYKYT